MKNQSEFLFQSPLVGDMIVGACARWGDKIALKDALSELTYSELSHRISTTIQYLKSIGFVAGDPIVLLTKNCVEGVVVFYAANVMGLDVDDYTKNGTRKHGGESLALIEAAHGELPATFSSSSRGFGVSGIRMFRA